ncbi:MAG: septum formation protein Maf [Candidatus Omnitrophica bacterium]|nr:septum formation protein Maf [Candidatus Omnitrophota bacterium]
MRRIILASKSRARKKLLAQIGLKVEIAVPDIREKRLLKSSCRDLVIANALIKAKSVAGHFAAAVVIAADTLVTASGEIIGKPKNKRDAFNTLRILSKKPQWVYTGLAVIDVAAGKVFTACGKTKVYMRRLTEQQIRSYLKRVSVLDKAGSFDIQGPGGIFIERIEGCFYNVVGLPLSKLTKILEKLGVDIFK